MQRLLYASFATPLATAYPAMALHNIVSTSITNNGRAKLTGFLLMFDKVFLQALEGEPEALDETYARIAEDPRHARLRVISREPIAKRGFAHWFMCGCQIQPHDVRFEQSQLTKLSTGQDFEPLAGHCQTNGKRQSIGVSRPDF